MKKVLKQISVISLVIVMCLSILAGCSTKPESTGGSTAEKPKEKYKIGVVVYDNTDLSQQAINKYLTEKIGPSLNIEFIISDAIKDSNGEISFLENCASKGVKGILPFYTVTDTKKLYSKLKELGMYYVAKPFDAEAAKGNPYILGGINTSAGDYDSAYEMAKTFLEGGARKIGMATGGKDMGVKQFVDRYNGVKTAIKDFEAKNPNQKVTLTEFAGFPGDAWFAQQGQMIASNPDAIIASFSGEFLWVQPITDAGKAGKIKLGTLSSITAVSAKAFAEGKLHFLGAIYPQLNGLNVAVLYNAMSGNSKDFMENGNPVETPIKIVNIKSADEMKQWVDLLNADVPPYSADDLKKVIKAFNPKATFKDFQDLAAASGYDAIVARRSAK